MSAVNWPDTTSGAKAADHCPTPVAKVADHCTLPYIESGFSKKMKLSLFLFHLLCSQELSQAKMTHNTYIHQCTDYRQQLHDNEQELKIQEVKNENAKVSESMQATKVGYYWLHWSAINTQFAAEDAKQIVEFRYYYAIILMRICECRWQTSRLRLSKKSLNIADWTMRNSDCSQNLTPV